MPKSLSIHLSSDIAHILESDCKHEGITLNSKVKQILTKYYEWEKPAHGLRVMMLSKDFFREILNQIDDDEISEIALKTTKPLFVSLTKFRSVHLDINNLIGSLEAYLKASQINFKHNKKNNNHKYFINHQLGRKYGVYITSLFDSMFCDVGYKLINVELHDNSMVFEITPIND